MKVAIAFVAALTAACTVNGKSVFAGPSSSPSSSPSQAQAPSSEPGAPPVVAEAEGAPAAAAPAASPGSCAVQHHRDAWPYANKPSDPSFAVSGGQPKRVVVADDRTGHATSTPKQGMTCDAAHDHCFRDCSWIVLDNGQRRGEIKHVDLKGRFVGLNHSGGLEGTDEVSDGEFIAYRTVPVTKKNLAKDKLVFVFVGAGSNYGTPPMVPPVPLNQIWDLGIVESIEWDRGLVRIEGKPDPYWLSATRLAVFQYKNGGKVEAVEGSSTATPAVADVILPKKWSGPSDPWSQVGKNKQPIAVDDKTKLSSLDMECNSGADHCLRSWVWFVDVDKRPVPARWNGTKFVYAEDATRVIEKPGMAYRTRPAKDGELKPGTKIIVYDSPAKIGSESAAHYRNGWEFAKVEGTDRIEKKVKLEGETDRPIDHARILVLWWLPGEDASKVE